MSERITFTADDATMQILETVEQRDDIDSTSAAVRECIVGYERLQTEYETVQNEYEQEIADLEQAVLDERNRADELRNMLKAANRRNDETEALVRYVEERETILGRVRSWFGRD